MLLSLCSIVTSPHASLVALDNGPLIPICLGLHHISCSSAQNEDDASDPYHYPVLGLKQYDGHEPH